MTPELGSNPIVVIDTETTGLGHVDRPPRGDGVVQVGISWRGEQGVVNTWHRTCHPGDEHLHAGRARRALEISGLSEGEVRGSPAVAVVAEQLRQELGRIGESFGGAVELRAYNRAFDEPFLCTPAWGLERYRWGPCIMLAAQVRLFGRYAKWPKLEESMRALGLDWPEPRAHHAGADSHAALLVDEIVSGRKRR